MNMSALEFYKHELSKFSKTQTLTNSMCNDYLARIKAEPEKSIHREQLFVRLMVVFLKKLNKKYPDLDEDKRASLSSYLAAHVKNYMARYDSAKNDSLLAYLHTYVFLELSKNYKYIMSQGMFNESQQKLSNKIYKAQCFLEKEHGRTPTNEEIASLICGTKDKYSYYLSAVCEYRDNTRPVVNFSELVRYDNSYDDDYYFESNIEDCSLMNDGEDFDPEYFRDYDHFGLSNREREFMEYFFMNLKDCEIAKLMNCSESNISKIKKNAFAKYKRVVLSEVSEL